MTASLRIDDAIRAARELLDAGQYTGVVAVCCQQLEQRPADVALLLLRARAWIALDRSAQAIDDLREVLTIDPRRAGAYRALGRLLLRSGDLNAARNAFLGALELSRDDREARAQLAAVDAALALAMALAAEAAALEEALAMALDEPELAAAAEAHLVREAHDIHDIPRPARGAAPRMPTEPMSRASTSAGGWRAPTMPLDLSSHATNAVARHQAGPSGGHGRRASTQPMARASTSAAPWRAPTMPVMRRPAPLAVPRVRAPGSGPIRATTAPFQRRVSTAPVLGRATTAVLTSADSSRLPRAFDERETHSARAGTIEMVRREG